MLAQIGALNNISADTKLHRRDALWQVEKAGSSMEKLPCLFLPGPTIRQQSAAARARTAVPRASRSFRPLPLANNSNQSTLHQLALL